MAYYVEPIGFTNPTIVDVLLVAGQSNANGNGLLASDLPTHLQGLNPGAKIWDGTRFVALVNGSNNANLCLVTSSSQNWGPEAEYAYQYNLSFPTRILYIIKFSVGGSYLEPGVNPSSWDPSQTGQYFDTMTGYVNGALAVLSALKVNASVKLVWMQGESETDTTGHSNGYAAALTTFIAAVKTRWSVNSKVLIGRISNSTLWTFRAAVRTAQSATPTPDVWIDTDSYPLQGDNAHYTAAGQVSFGQDLFRLGTLDVKPTGTFAIKTGVSTLTNGLIYYGFDTGMGAIKNLIGAANVLVPGTLPPTIGTSWGSALGWLGQPVDSPAVPGTYGIAGGVSTLDGVDADAVLTQASQLKDGTTGIGFSFACAIMQTGVATNEAQIFGRPAQANEQSPFSNWLLQANTSPNQLYCTVNNNGTQVIVGNTYAPSFTGVFTSMACTLQNDSAGSATGIFYINGAANGSTSSIALANSNFTAGQDPESQVMHGSAYHIGTGKGFLNFLGVVYYGAAWNRKLTAAEVLALHNNPYIFLN